MALNEGAPEISVVVPSHDRPDRLRRLLDALEEQTLPAGAFEVVVGHDSRGPETEELLRSHPLARAGRLRGVSLPPGTAPPGANRNAALRLVSAPLIAFTDDDCRPPPDWLERMLAAARRHPGAIVQGSTYPDPNEEHLLGLSGARTQVIEAPSNFAQACNILYPREVLERLKGFDEELETGEDVDLAQRAMKAGVPYVGAPEARNWHAVAVASFPVRLRSLWRWRHLPAVLKRHPEHRRAYWLWLFRGPAHVFVPLAIASVPLSRRNPLFALLAVPWLVLRVPARGGSPKARYLALAAVPGRAVEDVAEIAVLAWGSIRHRSLLL